MRDSATIYIRKRLLDTCSTKYEKVRFRDSTGKRIASGIQKARELIESAEVLADQRAYLTSIKSVVTAEKDRVRESTEDDEDGWYLGGLQSIVAAIEEEEARLG
jgi:hypothetical protein